MAGAPFPDLLDWTWGEIVEYITCKNEATRDELRTQASMDFRHVMFLVKALNAKRGSKFSVVEEYDFLWSKEERDKIAMDRFTQQMMAMCKTDEQGDTNG